MELRVADTNVGYSESDPYAIRRVSAYDDTESSQFRLLIRRGYFYMGCVFQSK